MVNKFLFLAYSFVWLIFVAYVWLLARRQNQLRKDLADLKGMLREKSVGDSRPPRL